MKILQRDNHREVRGSATAEVQEAKREQVSILLWSSCFLALKLLLSFEAPACSGWGEGGARFFSPHPRGTPRCESVAIMEVKKKKVTRFNKTDFISIQPEVNKNAQQLFAAAETLSPSQLQYNSGAAGHQALLFGASRCV